MGDSEDGNNKRARASKACESCKASRRKCSGGQPCDNCVKRGVECVFDDTPTKRRGPKVGSKSLKLQAENERLKVEIEQLRAKTSEVQLAVPNGRGSRGNSEGPVPKLTKRGPANGDITSVLSSAGHVTVFETANVWTISGPIIPSADEEGILRSYFEYTNRILPAVDEEYFYTALENAQYYAPDGDPSMDEFVVGASVPGPKMSTVARNSEAFGFRVCYHTILCVGAKLQGRMKLAKQYYEMARAYIGPVFATPSQHLVSALLVMTMITRSMCQDVRQAACHAALALRMSTDLVDVTPEVRMVAVIFNYANTIPPTGEATSPTAYAWPADAATSNSTPYTRFADILGFAVSQLMSNFPAVATQATAARFIRLLEESVALQTEQGIFSRFPLPALFRGISALLHYRTGHVILTIDEAKDCIELAAKDKLARYCFPAVFIIAKLMPVLREIAQHPDFGAVSGDKLRALAVNACSFLKESRETFSACPKLAAAQAENCQECATTAPSPLKAGHGETDECKESHPFQRQGNPVNEYDPPIQVAEGYTKHDVAGVALMDMATKSCVCAEPLQESASSAGDVTRDDLEQKRKTVLSDSNTVDVPKQRGHRIIKRSIGARDTAQESTGETALPVNPLQLIRLSAAAARKPPHLLASHDPSQMKEEPMNLRVGVPVPTGATVSIIPAMMDPNSPSVAAQSTPAIYYPMLSFAAQENADEPIPMAFPANRATSLGSTDSAPWATLPRMHTFTGATPRVPITPSLLDDSARLAAKTGVPTAVEVYPHASPTDKVHAEYAKEDGNSSTLTGDSGNEHVSAGTPSLQGGLVAAGGGYISGDTSGGGSPDLDDDFMALVESAYGDLSAEFDKEEAGSLVDSAPVIAGGVLPNATSSQIPQDDLGNLDFDDNASVLSLGVAIDGLFANFPMSLESWSTM